MSRFWAKEENWWNWFSFAITGVFMLCAVAMITGFYHLAVMAKNWIGG